MGQILPKASSTAGEILNQGERGGKGEDAGGCWHASLFIPQDSSAQLGLESYKSKSFDITPNLT
jgi:hypothetical protein